MTGKSEVLAAGCLEGLSCIVTGAGSGIGRAIALRLVALGAAVTGLGRRADRLEETGALAAAQAGVPGEGGGSFIAAPCDIRDRAALVDLVAVIGAARGIDALVNNAGGQFVSPAEATSAGGWDAVIDLNLTAVHTAITAAFPWLARRGGSIVNISLSLVERGSPGVAHSVAARSGVLGLTRTLALEWAQHGIRANCLGPGIVLTEAAESRYAHDIRAMIAPSVPMARATGVGEVAELVAFLVSPAGAMMTGQMLHIDGGQHLGPGLSFLGDDQQ